MVNMLLIGCGKMGGALLNGVLQKNLPWRITVLEPVRPAQPLKNLTYISQISELVDKPDVIILAVKPQQMDEVLRKLAFKEALIISIAAGKTLSYFREFLPEQVAIVRSMPNTPGSIGAGVTVAVADKGLSPEHQAIADHILGALGKLLWITDESLMDAVTALSGSGPAYVFYLAEVMTDAGIKLGLTPEMAAILARETVIGSAGLLKDASTKTPEQLRIEVTSPHGTTEAALTVLMQDESMKSLFHKALTAAAERSKKLSHGC